MMDDGGHVLVLCCRRRGGEEQDTTGFVTLEALMLSRQEEERQTQTHFHAPEVPQFRAPPPPVSQKNLQGMILPIRVVLLCVTLFLMYVM